MQSVGRTLIFIVGSLLTCFLRTEAQTTPLNFVPVAPCRVADTRMTNGPFGGPSIAGGTKRDFPIPQSSCGIPPTAAAYSLNFTVIPNGSLGYLTVWPTGLTQPLVSTMNSPDGRVKANAAIVPAGSSGAVSTFVTDTTDLAIDINGYFVTDTNQLAFYPLPPCRMIDTRNSMGPMGGPAMMANQARDFPMMMMMQTCGIPASAKAYSLNVTVVPNGGLGYLSVWPSGSVQPIVSTLNAMTGAITANGAIVPAGTSGSITAFASDDTEMIADINGYFAPPGMGGQSFHAFPPCRVMDTRSGTGAFVGQMTIDVAAAPCGLPASASAFVTNVTVIPEGMLDYLTLWSNGSVQPVVSTLNALDGAITSNMAIVPALNGMVDAFATNSTNLVMDVSGYYGPSATAP